MHELSFCRSLLAIVEKKATELNCTKITTIEIAIGELLALDQKAFSMCFSLLAKGTCAAETQLIFTSIEGIAECADCQKQTPYPRYYDACKQCSGFNLTILRGEELIIRSMEVQ